VLAGPPPRTPPGTIDRQGHVLANARIVTEMHGSARNYAFSSNTCPTTGQKRARLTASPDVPFGRTISCFRP